MTQYKHILLTTDFSEGSKLVNERAFELSKLNKAKLSVIHVIEPLPGYGYGVAGLAEIEIQLAEESKKRLTELGEKYNISKNNLYTEIGSPKNIINKKAEELGVDLIIVGSHEKEGLDYILGSTANGVIQKAKCDVLTVKMR